MSSTIAEAITNAQTRREAIYTKINNLKGTIPSTKNLSNVPSAIDSIFKTSWKPVNYIEKTTSNQSAYINTKINPTLTTFVNLKMIPTSTITSNMYGTFVGSRSGNHTADSFYFAYSGNNTSAREEIGTSRVITGSITKGNITTVTFSANKMIINGTTISQSSTLSSFSSSLPLWIFAMNVNGILVTDWNAHLGYMKLYRLNIVQDGITVMDLVPCILVKNIEASKDSQGIAKSVGAIGMWDLIGDKFYGNAGSGSFVAG